MNYKNKINLIFIILVTISFLLYRFGFDRNGNLFSANYIIMYIIFLGLIISFIINLIKKRND
ncbi:TPA: hypothetical protein ACSQRE_000124 [Clostridium perfringens]|uniref:hypothetical protein n=1 Tax=Clostridium perfringens TaxID=1502 RepID=UPI001FA8F491|nr:hypothetical protein [Clostridium perfringens]